MTTADNELNPFPRSAMTQPILHINHGFSIRLWPSLNNHPIRILCMISIQFNRTQRALNRTKPAMNHKTNVTNYKVIRSRPRRNNENIIKQ